MKNHTSNNLEHQDEGHSHQPFDNPELFTKRFDAPERDEWQKPEQVIDALNLSDNATVVEVGAGTGYFTVRLAEHLKNGNVIALETSPKMAAYLENRVGGSALKNVHVRLSEPGGQTNLPGKIDLIMCVDSYHHIKDRVVYFSHIKQQLKLGGMLVIIDRPTDSPVVPQHGHQTPPEVVKKEMKEAGFDLTQELDFLLPYQFYLAFKLMRFYKEL
jgi:cyclopropane fatty-acyl-phospholipid synthase-like methyltransferase